MSAVHQDREETDLHGSPRAIGRRAVALSRVYCIGICHSFRDPTRFAPAYCPPVLMGALGAGLSCSGRYRYSKALVGLRPFDVPASFVHGLKAQFDRQKFVGRIEMMLSPAAPENTGRGQLPRFPGGCSAHVAVRAGDPRVTVPAVSEEPAARQLTASASLPFPVSTQNSPGGSSAAPLDVHEGSI